MFVLVWVLSPIGCGITPIATDFASTTHVLKVVSKWEVR
jgi:hypothetical protein